MALTAFSDHGALQPEESLFLRQLFQEKWTLRKGDFNNLPIYNAGVQTPELTRVAYHFSQALFELFSSKVAKHAPNKLNLLIAGGCGLNCDWNVQWRNLGLFNDVFIPPVVNDSGVAIGAAVDGQLMLTGSAKVAWSVYSGLDLNHDIDDVVGFRKFPLDIERIAALLMEDEIVAWSQGRCEIGPRALGDRSLLAPPFCQGTTKHLNQIKERESYRPIAPICLESVAGKWFSGPLPSPYMLGFSAVLDSHLKAVTHVDNSARVQTVNTIENPAIHALLSSFQSRSGYGVLCNTSLNHKGRGFLNRVSDIAGFCRKGGIRVFVADQTMFLRDDIKLVT
jgi:hydroxymethyl cephem carbamoyltransferase